MGKINEKFIGLSQYKIPFCYELAGKHFHFVMDSGAEYSMLFLDGETVQWALKGEAYRWDTYECMKGDDTTYFVHIAPCDGKGMINHSWIIDTAQNLVTFVLMEEGYDKALPRLIKTTPYFGAIKLPGRELAKIRHHLSARMNGRHIFWHYNPGFAIQHIYNTPTMIRADSGAQDMSGMMGMLEEESRSEDPKVRENAQKRIDAWKKRSQYYPFYEEECFHIWISERLNLFCFVEENMNRCDPEHGQGGGGILLLQDVERLVDAGLSFCAGEYYMCSAFGVENEDKDPLDDRESPYDWSKFDAMPSIYWKMDDEKK